MAILQALLTLISKSASTVLNAIFGWAVLALFGRTSPKQQTVLSGVVGMAAAWPILVLGIIVPRVTTFLVAFIPLSKHVPAFAIRLVWAGLALIVPIGVGLVFAAKAPPRTPPENVAVRILRGFPITLGIAIAFLMMFVTVPILRVVSLARKWKDEHVASITEGDEYATVSAHIDQILERYHLDATRAEPAWWLATPSRILQAMCGKALRGFLPERLSYWSGPQLEIAFYPSDILIRGSQDAAGYTHGLLAEQLVFSAGLQTFDPEAQKIERRIRALAHEQVHAHGQGAKQTHVKQLKLVMEDLATLHVGYDDWQVLYRQAAQVGRAIEGEPQLLDLRFPAAAAGRVVPSMEAPMHNENIDVSSSAPLATVGTTELLERLVDRTSALVKKELELAKAEVREDVAREVKAAEGLGVASLAAISVINLLFVAAAFALTGPLPGWAAALVIAGGVLVLGGGAALFGWHELVKKPLDRTQRTLKDDVHFAKERIA